MAAMELPRWLAATVDVLTEHVAEPQLPIERIVASVGRRRALGSQERTRLGDLAFASIRIKAGALKAIDDTAQQLRLKPVSRDRLLTWMALAMRESDMTLEASWPPDVAALLAALPAHTERVLPEWLRQRLTHLDAGEIEALSGRAPVVLAFDRRHLTAEAVVATLAEAGVQARAHDWVPNAIVVEGALRLSRFPDSFSRHVWPMDAGSQAIAQLCQDADTVVDVCSGGGGKARLLAAMGARVVALDIHAGRLRESTHASVRAVANACALPLRDHSVKRLLVDAPCTGTGTLRRHPDVALRLTPEAVAGAASLQQKILADAYRALAVGGVLIYATCSLLREENDDVIDAFFATTASAEPAPLAALGMATRKGQPIGRRWLLPVADGCDGFFVAAIRKRA